MIILETCELKKYYGSGDTVVHALDGVNITIENGEFVAIIGTSGSGKSTLLHMMGGLDRPTSGKVTVEEGGTIPSTFRQIYIKPWWKNPR